MRRAGAQVGECAGARVIPSERSARLVIPSERSESRNLHLLFRSRSSRNVFSRRGAEVRRGAEDHARGRDARTATQLLSSHDSKREVGSHEPTIQRTNSHLLGSAFMRCWRRGLARSSPSSAAPRELQFKRRQKRHGISRGDAETRTTAFRVEIPVWCETPLHPQLK